VDFVTGSTRFGSIAANTHVFTGSMSVSGSITAINTISSYNAVTVYQNNNDTTPAQLLLSDTSNARQLLIGYNSGSNYGSIQAVHQGVGYRSLVLNSQGGNVGIGTINPGSALDVATSGNVNAIFNSTATQGGYISFQRSGTAFGYIGQSYHIVTGGSVGDMAMAATASMVFSTGGSLTERMKITSTGNVGIGTTNPLVKFQITQPNGIGLPTLGTSTGGLFIAGDGNQYGLYIGNDGNTGNSWLQAMRNNTATSYNILLNPVGGDVLIGTTTSAGKLTVTQTTNTCGLQVYMPNSITTPVIQLSSVAAGSTSWYALVAQSGNGSSITANTCFIYGNGNIVNTNGSYGTLSDISLKENITDTTPKLSKLLQLKVRNFNLKADENKTKQIGFVAQEFEEVFPSMVEIDGNTNLKSIKTSVLVPMLIKAIQEQQAQIEELKSQINK
jgi:hypothetical protein